MKKKKKNNTLQKKEIAIQLKHVTKQYFLHHEKPTFSEKLLNVKKKEEKFVALNDVNLTLYKGDKVGIIGRNGAGKTTLLKIISGITTPNSGEVITNGKIVSLIDLEAGFHPDLTGQENIFLNALIIGMSRQEAKKKFDDIVEFAGIGSFIDSPMYTYSSGMKLRLGFAIAVHAEPEILVLDEGVATGDQWFRTKAQKKLEQFFSEKRTIITVSHWLDYLRGICKKIVWIDEHKIQKIGEMEVLNEYENQLAS